VSRSSPSACTTTGVRYAKHTPSGLAERWNGSTWTVQTVPGAGITLGGVACPTAGFCIATGGPDKVSPTPGAYTWTAAGGWSAEMLATPAHATDAGVGAISCLSATTCTAVGHYARTPGSKGTSGVLAEHE
jgi:hypothetical protein